MNKLFMASVLIFLNAIILIIIEVNYPGNVNMVFVIIGIGVAEVTGLISIIFPLTPKKETTEEKQ